ncbi:MAG: hypothetical protein F4X25_05235 [Chloroflexi bacterium]|nr:hypothetical protein [Chloroflexota bacterium]
MRKRQRSQGTPSVVPARAPSVLIAGAATRDHFADEQRPGGAVLYAARAAAALGVRARILTIAGADAGLEALDGHDGTVVNSAGALTFVHMFYPEGGERLLRVLARPERALSATDLPCSHAGAELDLLVLAPLLPDDLDLDSFAGVPARRRALLAQGLLREVGADGLVSHADAPPPALRAAVDARTSVFLSEDEIARWDASALPSLAESAERVVVTRGARGATILRGGTRIETSARPAEAVDSTGCGDVFSVAHMIALVMGADDARAAAVGAELAAAALGLAGAQPLPAVRIDLPGAVRAGV